MPVHWADLSLPWSQRQLQGHLGASGPCKGLPCPLDRIRYGRASASLSPKKLGWPSDQWPASAGQGGGRGVALARRCLTWLDEGKSWSPGGLGGGGGGGPVSTGQPQSMPGYGTTPGQARCQGGQQQPGQARALTLSVTGSVTACTRAEHTMDGGPAAAARRWHWNWRRQTRLGNDAREIKRTPPGTASCGARLRLLSHTLTLTTTQDALVGPSRSPFAGSPVCPLLRVLLQILVPLFRET